LSVNAPPIRGPTIEETPKVAPMRPMYIGRFASGMMWMRMTLEPENMLADPRPAIARPMMNAVEFGAAPHNAEPTSKMPIATR